LVLLEDRFEGNYAVVGMVKATKKRALVKKKRTQFDSIDDLIYVFHSHVVGIVE
ncbi:18523_t:CDS:2, partial [Racocetra persica]